LLAGRWEFVKAK